MTNWFSVASCWKGPPVDNNGYYTKSFEEEKSCINQILLFLVYVLVSLSEWRMRLIDTDVQVS